MIYRFDRFTFDTDGPGLKEDGVEVPLEPQVFALLKYLLEHRDTIVSKDTLNQEVWQGRFVSDSALTTRIRAVRRALGDDARQQKFIRTFPKRGFQFVAEIDGTSVNTRVQGKTRPLTNRHIWAGTAAVVFIVLAVFAWVGWGSGLNASLQLPDQPSIAVTPFANLNEQEGDDYFANGLTEDIITNLARYRELFVSSRNSTFGLSTGDVEPARLAEDLGVAFIARGSVRRKDGRVRVTAELVDAQSGATIWAERFDRDLNDLFDVQDEISQAIAGQLVPEVVKAGAYGVRTKRTEDLNAWDLYLKARSAQGALSEHSQGDAVRFAMQAIELDPEFAAAHSLIARARGNQFFHGWTDNPALTLEEAIRYARRALELDQTDPVAYATLGYIYRFNGNEEQAISNLQRAAELNPNDAVIRLQLAHTLDWFRKQDLALPQINLATRLSPRDPRLQNMYFYKAHILFHLRRFDEALEAAQAMSGVLTTDTWRVLYNLVRAANLAELGRSQEAGQAIAAALKINGKLSISAMKKQFEGSKNHPDNRQIWLESLRKAGLPE